jgi:hypothetical protein
MSISRTDPLAKKKKWTADVQPGVRGWGSMRSIFDFRFAIFDLEEKAGRVSRVPRPTVALPTTSRRYSPDASGQSCATADMRRATLSRATATWRHGGVNVYGSGGFARINADELMQVVDFPHPRGVRFLSGRSGVFPSIGDGFELQKVKSSAWARLGSLKTAWARLARGCRETIFARKWGYGDASDPKRRVRLRSCLRPTPAFAGKLPPSPGFGATRRRGKSAQPAEAMARLGVSKRRTTFYRD